MRWWTARKLTSRLPTTSLMPTQSVPNPRVGTGLTSSTPRRMTPPVLRSLEALSPLQKCLILLILRTLRTFLCNRSTRCRVDRKGLGLRKKTTSFLNWSKSMEPKAGTSLPPSFQAGLASSAGRGITTTLTRASLKRSGPLTRTKN